ncbi:hypothetical protein ACQEVG_11225 [Streptomyces sp. CA-135486]|uniref:hypothetical protein n=1 Tax=Streptomyces sp. CA-135486 TaxID=3240049 RepID=UPI003D90A647
MPTIRDKLSAVRKNLLPPLAGAACAVSAAGVALAMAGVHSPLRAPFVLFFLFAGPAGGLAAALPRLDPATRATMAATGAIVIDLAVAQSLSSPRVLTVDGGITAVAMITALLFLWALGRRIRNPEHLNTADRLMKGIKTIGSGLFASEGRISIKKVKK